MTRPVKVKGVLRYDPSVQTESGEIFDPWWLILEYDAAILDRWREVAEKRHRIRLSYPRWGAHISIVSGEIPARRSRWGWRNGEEIEFEYRPVVETDGVFYWIPARCEALLGIRESLGLPRIPRHSLHMTLGRVKR
jgi:hypothetical protein